MEKRKLEKCVVEAVIKGGDTIVGTLPLSAGGWTSNEIFKKGGLTGPQFLEGGCWERGGLLGGGALQFSDKNKLKSEIFNDKISL